MEVDRPLTGIRKRLVDKIYTFYTWSSVVVLGMSVVTEDLDNIDYSKYLGPEYKKEFKMSKSSRASTYVGNHSGIMDIMSLIYVLGGDVGFVAGAFL